MSLQHYHINPIDAFEQSLQNFFGDSDRPIFRHIRQVKPTAVSTKIDMQESETESIINAELPGFKKENIKLDLDEEQGYLTLSGESQRDETHNESQIHYSERSYGKFTRSIKLPRNSQYDKVDAKFEDGVLKITVPKGEKVSNRTISIS